MGDPLANPLVMAGCLTNGFDAISVRYDVFNCMMELVHSFEYHPLDSESSALGNTFQAQYSSLIL